MPNIKYFQTELATTYVETPVMRPSIDGSQTLLGESGNTTIDISLTSPRINKSAGYYILDESTIQDSIITNAGASGDITFYLPPAKIKLAATFHRVAPYQMIIVPYGNDSIHEGAPGQGIIFNSRCLFTLQTIDYGQWDISLSGPNPTFSYGQFTYGYGV